MSETKVAPLTLDEIIELISDVARNGEGPDRFRALKHLTSLNSATAALPDPMPDVDLIDRLARLMKAVGTELTQKAYNRAFPNRGRSLAQAVPKFRQQDLLVDRNTLPKSLKQLYKKFPEIKRHGFPPGFPAGRGLAMQQEWCQDRAMKILVDRERVRLEAAAAEQAAADAMIREEGSEADAAPGPAPVPEA